MTEEDKKYDIIVDILELTDDYEIEDVLDKLQPIMTLDQWRELYNSFYEPPEERSDYDEHNTMHKNFH